MSSQITKHLKKKPSTRDSILISACECFARHGFHGTTVRMIAEFAETPLSSLHYHFGNKEELFKEVVKFLLGIGRKLGDDIDEELRALKKQGASEIERIEHMLGMWVDFNFAHPELSQIALHQMAEFDIEEPLKRIHEVLPADEYAIGKISSYFNLPKTREFRSQIMASNMVITGFVGGRNYHKKMLGKNVSDDSYKELVKSTISVLFKNTFQKS